jgi:hypothetical protein
MKYETPELTALTPAINAIQSSQANKGPHELNADQVITGGENESTGAYADWE